MGIIIREADLQHDRKAMRDCLLRNRTRYENNDTFEARFDWAYQHNPHGMGRAWLALDEGKNRVIGFTSAFPRQCVINGKKVTGWNCADFSIDKEYRTLGAAMKLRRAAKECVDRGEFPFLFAHPNNRMVVVHEKVGHKPIGKMVRYAALLRLNEKLADFLGDNLIASGLARLANPLLHFVMPGRSRAGDFTFEIVEEKHFGEDYEKLFERVAQQHQVIACRDARYLTWRFLRNPLYRTLSFRMLQHDKLAGYVLFYENDSAAHIGDLLVAGGETETRLLLSALVYHLRHSDYGSVSLRLHDLNPMLAVARQLGFRYRDDATSTVIAYAHPASPHASTLLDGRNWYMTVGDRDI